MSVLALAGGVGGAKLARGLAAILPPGTLTIAVNTGDDFTHLGLTICPDIDSVMRVRRGVLVVRHRLGLVLANAGIDQSNIAQDGDGVALLLPVDPDTSAAALRDRLAAHGGADIAVVIIDSLGRAWRKGTCGIAIGVAGMAGLLDLRGVPDLHGRPLQTSELGLADEVAAAASLVMGQGGEGRPVVLARGIARGPAGGCAADLIREPALDLFP